MSDAASVRDLARGYAVPDSDAHINRLACALLAALDEVDRVSKENASLRGYVTTVAAGMSRNDLLAIEKEFTDAEA